MDDDCFPNAPDLTAEFNNTPPLEPPPLSTSGPVTRTELERLEGERRIPLPEPDLTMNGPIAIVATREADTALEERIKFIEERFSRNHERIRTGFEHAR